VLGDERDIRERGCAEIWQKTLGSAGSLVSLAPHGELVEVVEMCLV
jgi:hypothetical protein